MEGRQAPQHVGHHPDRALRAATSPTHAHNASLQHLQGQGDFYATGSSAALLLTSPGSATYMTGCFHAHLLQLALLPAPATVTLQPLPSPPLTCKTSRSSSALHPWPWSDGFGGSWSQ